MLYAQIMAGWEEVTGTPPELLLNGFQVFHHFTTMKFHLIPSSASLLEMFPEIFCFHIHIFILKAYSNIHIYIHIYIPNYSYKKGYLFQFGSLHFFSRSLSDGYLFLLLGHKVHWSEQTLKGFALALSLLRWLFLTWIRPCMLQAMRDDLRVTVAQETTQSG